MPDRAEELPLSWSPGLDRGFAVSGPPAGGLYLRPTGLIAGAEAQAATRAGHARWLAGGPLAFTQCEVLRRRADHVAAACVPLPALESWLAGDGAGAATHLGAVLEAASAPRPPFAGLALDRPRIMGIVNVTPDSFSDGGDHFDAAAAIAHGRALAEQGADILDVGGESTRPGSEAVPPTEEIRRVGPVLDGLSGAGPVLSIDTRHAEVMGMALDRGVAIVNDVTALAGDAGSLDLVAKRGPAVVLMHMQGEPRTMQLAPRYASAALDIYDLLAARVAACVAAGIPRARIAVDPGLGFGKKLEHNLGVLERLALFHGLGCAILLGASRKSLLGRLTGSAAPKARLGASLAAALHALGQGVQMIRVHDVAETVQATAFWRALNPPAGRPG